MKILMINSVCGIKSTGRICTDLATELKQCGHDIQIAYGREHVPSDYSDFAIKIGSKFDIMMHGICARAFDSAGFGSRYTTEKFISWAMSYDPDVIHLHNLHGYYINLPVLFRYLKQSNKKIIWTLHDCWPFTGHCCYFDYANCDNWKVMCENCPQKREYPGSYISRAKINYMQKKELFTNIPNMTIVTPSEWLASLVRQSYMKEYPIKVIHNWVDTNVFTETASDFKKQYGIEDKRIVLGVASVWDRRKGLDTFLKLDTVLNDDYKIVLVGLNDSQLKMLPKSIIGIGRTDNIKQLAGIYSSADVYVNPTLEDNYPTTNLEAIACGTPVVTYDAGGSGESANLFGVTVPKGDFLQLVNAIQDVVIHKSGLIKPDIKMFNELSFDSYLQLIEKSTVGSL